MHLEDYNKRMAGYVKCAAHGHSPVICAVCVAKHCPTDTTRLYDENICPTCAARPRTQLVSILKQNPEVRKCISDVLGTARILVDSVFNNSSVGTLFTLAAGLRISIEHLDPDWADKLDKPVFEQLAESTKVEERKEAFTGLVRAGTEELFAPLFMHAFRLGMRPVNPMDPEVIKVITTIDERYKNKVPKGSLACMVTTDAAPRSAERDNQISALRKHGKDLGWTILDDEKDGYIACLLAPEVFNELKSRFKALGDEDGTEAKDEEGK